MSDRDGWCTPKWLTDLLPHVDLDPCSNDRSTVRAKVAYSLETNQNGLELPWFGLTFVNGPFSDLLPWAEKLQCEIRHIYGAAFLVNTDSSTQWWRLLARLLPCRFDFSKRIQFDPPPGVQPSGNSKPQTLLCTETFWRECDEGLAALGVLWRRA